MDWNDRQEFKGGSRWKNFLRIIQVSETGYPFDMDEHVHFGPYQTKLRKAREERKEELRMKTLKDQMIEKGLAEKPEKKEVEEVYTGEVTMTAGQEIAAHRRSIYRPKQKLWDHRERHGRTIHIKPMEEGKMEKKEIIIMRESKLYKTLSLIWNHAPITTDALHTKVCEVMGKTQSKMTTYGMLSLATKWGVLKRVSVVGERGAGYQFADPAWTVDDAYRKYQEGQATLPKYEKRQKEVQTKPDIPEAKRSINMYHLPEKMNIVVDVNHKIEIVFRMEPLGVQTGRVRSKKPNFKEITE